MFLYEAECLEKTEKITGYYVYEENTKKHIILKNNGLGYYRTQIKPESLKIIIDNKHYFKDELIKLINSN